MDNSTDKPDGTMTITEQEDLFQPRIHHPHLRGRTARGLAAEPGLPGRLGNRPRRHQTVARTTPRDMTSRLSVLDQCPIGETRARSPWAAK
jgi:hypothetical protein